MVRLIVGFIGWIISMTLAAGMTLALFYFMQSLISSGDRLDNRIRVIKLVDATMPEVDMIVIEEIDKPKLVEELSEHQPELQDKHINLNEGPSLNIERATVQINTGMDFSIASISTADGDYLPLVAIAPEYPTRAALRDIEGWCIVSFTVSAQGNVVEDTIQVVDAEPPGVFNRSAMRAAARFKFQPRTKNGVGVEVPEVQYLFRFEFED
jgi:protein TonB